MSDKQVAYIAGMGMVTPVGTNVEMTAAAVKAGISGYGVSDFYGQDDEPITMSLVPDEFFTSVDIEIDEGDYFSESFDRAIKMAHVSIRESLAKLNIDKPIPFYLGLPEPITNINLLVCKPITTNLLRSGDLPISSDLIRTLSSGRVSGIQAIEGAVNSFSLTNWDYAIIGGIDSYYNFSHIQHLSADKRLLSEGANNGFALGEAAGFIVLTSSAEQALIINNHLIAVHPPGLTEEKGHLYSEEAYMGEGLHHAFKEALSGAGDESIGRIYSSLNGEQFWAKELGVAMTRNNNYLKDNCMVEHPIDCLGDIGAATAPVLIGLASMDLLNNTQDRNALIYCSSDSKWRGAVRLEKRALPSN